MPTWSNGKTTRVCHGVTRNMLLKKSRMWANIEFQKRGISRRGGERRGQRWEDQSCTPAKLDETSEDKTKLNHMHFHFNGPTGWSGAGNIAEEPAYIANSCAPSSWAPTSHFVNHTFCAGEIDLPTASPSRYRRQLQEHGVLLERWLICK